VRKFSIDPNPGSAFAVDINKKGDVFDQNNQGDQSNQGDVFGQFAYIDDFVSNCTIWKLPINGRNED
jgi:hypothetical protein